MSMRNIKILVGVVGLLFCTGAAIAQTQSPFSNYNDSGEALVQGKPNKSNIGAETEKDDVWLYIRAKSAEYSETGNLTHFGKELSAGEVATLGPLILEFKEKYLDDIESRMARVCSTYGSGTELLSKEDRAENALAHLETGEEVRGRWKTVSEAFIRGVESAGGHQLSSRVEEESARHGKLAVYFSARTTRDVIESEGLDKVAYIENACS